MQKMKLLLTLLLIGIIANVTAPKANAVVVKQFLTDYAISYEIQPTGETQVIQNITITNLKSDVIATNFSHTLFQLDVYEITATVNNKNVDPKVEKKDQETQISLLISGGAIGEGRQNKIVLRYKTKNIATKTGDIWNIYIPKTQMSDATSAYNVTLAVPEVLGPKLYVSPLPVVEKNSTNVTTYSFTKEILSDKGITAAFGKYQTLNYRLRYQLQNTSIFSARTEIALPQDITGVQQVAYTSIKPLPQDINLDIDGNPIATYKIGAKQSLEIEVVGTARLTGKQINPTYGGKFASIPKELVAKYTQPQKYWQTKAPEIKTLAEKLKDDNKSVTENAKSIYEYLTKNLTYNYDAVTEASVQRSGALAALTTKGPWTCMEFTDLFIATSRAMGIPAREINGYAFTSDAVNAPISVNLKGGDLLHSWPEFYDPFYGWVQVDPTWGTTSGIDYFSKLDTTHFALVIKGVSSEYPLPAGVYRFSPKTKLVEVEFSQNQDDKIFDTHLKLTKIFNWNLIELLKGNEKYKLVNTSKIFVYGINGRELAPNKATTMYLPKDSTEFTTQDYNGNKVINYL